MTVRTLTRYGRRTSGRYVYKAGSAWYWQCDLHDRTTADTAGRDLYDTQQGALMGALDHARVCPHSNALAEVGLTEKKENAS